jgi:hypothetical protein
MSGTRSSTAICGPSSRRGFRRILEDKAVGLQIPVLLQPAAPGFVAVSGHGHQLVGKIPTIEHEPTKWAFAPDCGLQQVNAEIDLGAKRSVQRLKVRVFYQEGIDCLLEARPVLACGRDRTVRGMLVDERFPANALFIAPIQAESHGKTARATYLMTGARIVRERIRLLAMIIMAIDIVE